MDLTKIVIVINERKFFTTVATASQSEYLKDTMEMDDYNGIIELVDKSDEIFAHILEFMRDEHYPIPRFCENQLKFFRVNYDPNIWERCKNVRI